MIGTSTTEWIFIRLSIVAFRYAPCFYATAIGTQLLLHGYAATSLNSTRILTTLLAAEASFYVLLWLPGQRRLEQRAIHPEPLSRDERRALFDECLANVPSAESYLRWWFLGADIKDIGRENLREFVLWAFFDQDVASARGGPEIEAEVDDFISQFEARLRGPLSDGRGPARCLRLTFDSIETAYRGLAWYTVVFMVDQLTHLALKWHGFQYHASASSASMFPPRPQRIVTARESPSPDISYWIQPHRAGPGTLPVVFFHGIGIGLWAYARFLRDIYAASREGGEGAGVLAVEMLPISFRLTSAPLDSGEFVRQMTRILDHHGWGDIAAVSHSYGSVVTSHILRSPQLRHRVASVVLIDPVTVLLHLPQVAYNFTRRRPRGANEWQLWYFASTDPGVAHCLGRHFFWTQNVIWRDQLLFFPGQDGGPRQRKVAVCLAGRDLIVDTGAVAQYLKAGGSHTAEGSGPSSSVEVLLFPDLDHAQVFDDAHGSSRIVHLVRSYCAAT